MLLLEGVHESLFFYQNSLAVLHTVDCIFLYPLAKEILRNVGCSFGHDSSHCLQMRPSRFHKQSCAARCNDLHAGKLLQILSDSETLLMLVPLMDELFKVYKENCD